VLVHNTVSLDNKKPPVLSTKGKRAGLTGWSARALVKYEKKETHRSRLT
jgi:hypothetical protein